MSEVKSSIGHLVYLIHDLEKNIESYKKLFNYLGYQIIGDEKEYFAVTAPNNFSIWFMEASVEAKNNRDSNGVNHLGINVQSKEEVDIFVEKFLKPNNIECLFDTPKERPEFGTYYQVMFELPGNLLFEVLFTSY